MVNIKQFYHKNENIEGYGVLSFDKVTKIGIVVPYVDMKYPPFIIDDKEIYINSKTGIYEAAGTLIKEIRYPKNLDFVIDYISE